MQVLAKNTAPFMVIALPFLTLDNAQGFDHDRKVSAVLMPSRLFGCSGTIHQHGPVQCVARIMDDMMQSGGCVIFYGSENILGSVSGWILLLIEVWL